VCSAKSASGAKVVIGCGCQKGKKKKITSYACPSFRQRARGTIHITGSEHADSLQDVGISAEMADSEIVTRALKGANVEGLTVK